MGRQSGSGNGAGISEARRQLASGDVRDASATFNRAKAQAYAGKDQGAGFQQLEQKLKTAAASDLIQAQSNFTLHNSGQMALGRENAGAQTTQPGLQYDGAAAEQQWTKLQQAQEIVAAKVQPLHVNLPERGRHLAFTQVLQTETGQPLTIRLLAMSTKATTGT